MFNNVMIVLYSDVNEISSSTYLVSLLYLFTEYWIAVVVDGIQNKPDEPEQGHEQEEHGQGPVDYSHRTKTNQVLAQNMHG